MCAVDGAVIRATPVLVAYRRVAGFALWSSFRPLTPPKLPDVSGT
jgi:hypothetical protein